eukprot:359290-Chlamydomonas_euryale.AAC.6
MQTSHQHTCMHTTPSHRAFTRQLSAIVHTCCVHMRPHMLRAHASTHATCTCVHTCCMHMRPHMLRAHASTHAACTCVHTCSPALHHAKWRANVADRVLHQTEQASANKFQRLHDTFAHVHEILPKYLPSSVFQCNVGSNNRAKNACSQIPPLPAPSVSAHSVSCRISSLRTAGTS